VHGVEKRPGVGGGVTARRSTCLRLVGHTGPRFSRLDPIPTEPRKSQPGRRKDASIGFSAHQMVCCCLAISNETEGETRRSAALFEGARGLDAPGAGFADFYPRPGEIISQPLVVFEEATELEFGH